MVKEYPNVPIWIAGDLNLPNINWNNTSIEGNSYPIPLCNVFLDFLNTFGFTQIVNFATRDKHTLDIFCTNRPSFVKQCFPLPGIGDHDTVVVESSAMIQINPRSKEQQGKLVLMLNRNGLTAILNVYLVRNKDTIIEHVIPNYRVTGNRTK